MLPFLFLFYSVVECGSDLEADWPDLSGIFTSKFPGRSWIEPYSCSTSIGNLPYGSIVKLKWLTIIGDVNVSINNGGIQNIWITKNSPKTQSIIMQNEDNAPLHFQYYADVDGSDFVKFVIEYSGTCTQYHSL